MGQSMSSIWARLTLVSIGLSLSLRHYILPHFFFPFWRIPPHAADTLFEGQSMGSGRGNIRAWSGAHLVLEDGNLSIFWHDDKLWQTDTVGMGGSGDVFLACVCCCVICSLRM